MNKEIVSIPGVVASFGFFFPHFCFDLDSAAATLIATLMGFLQYVKMGTLVYPGGFDPVLYTILLTCVLEHNLQI